MSTALAPPKCPKKDHLVSYHGGRYSRPDPFFWLRDDERKNPEMLAFLNAENEYSEGQLITPLKELRQKVYEEFVGRLKEDDEEVPIKKGPFEYYKRTGKGLQYPIYCRKGEKDDDNKEEILLDLNSDQFKGESFLHVGNFKVSPDHQKVAYSLDKNGGESYSIVLKDLRSGAEITPKVALVKSYYSLEWSKDSKSIFYDVHDEVMRPFQVYRYNLETGDLRLLYEELDKKFEVEAVKTDSGRFLVIQSSSSLTRENFLVDTEAEGEGADVVVKPFSPRVFKHRYTLEHLSDYFYVLSNGNGATNYALYRVPVAKWKASPATGLPLDQWEPVMPYDPAHSLEGLNAFPNFLILYECTQDANKKIRVFPTDRKTGALLPLKNSFHVPFDAPVYAFQAHSEQVYESNVLRYSWSTMINPEKVADFDLDSKHRNIRKEKQVLGGYDPSLYTLERIFVKSGDSPSVNIPVSLAYRKDAFKKDGNAPCLLYGYGSYGISIDPVFKQTWVSYLDRGFVVAIAHIRGGGDCGKVWYEAGKFLQKKHTFEDFIRVAEHLIDNQYTCPARLAIEGRSAGGLLMGAVVNMRPDLFHAVIAGVPFVDVINTMMDESIPLTVNEYEEWGNPNDLPYFDYMLSYSPYDNIPENAGNSLPNMLVRGGLFDPRVQYWEPAKYVAKLRDLQEHADKKKTKDSNSNSSRIFLMMEMKSGHFGSSGRYAYLFDLAIEYAFVIDACCGKQLK